jgi:hypothetical protein
MQVEMDGSMEGGEEGLCIILRERHYRGGERRKLPMIAVLGVYLLCLGESR